MLDNFLKKQYEPYNQVYSHESGHKLFLGDVSAAKQVAIIEKQQIGFVVTAAADMEHVEFQDGVRHVRFDVYDSKTENLSKLFQQFSEITQRQLRKTNVLVHCFAGISRSATLVIAYLMKKQKWSFKEAIFEIRKYRPKVLPNLGFERQLKQYEKKLLSFEQIQERRHASKTSESKKQMLKHKKLGLPEIFGFGGISNKSKMNSHVSKQYQFFPNAPEEINRGSLKTSCKSPTKKVYFRQMKNQMDDHFIDGQGHPGSDRVVSKNMIKSSLKVPEQPLSKQYFPMAYTEDLQTKNIPLRSFRKRSIFPIKNQLKPDLDLYSRNGNRASMKTVIGKKINLRGMKFSTQKNLRQIPLDSRS